MTSSKLLKMTTEFDASFIYYLLTLFEGHISYTEILEMDLNLLFELKQYKEYLLTEKHK